MDFGLCNNFLLTCCRIHINFQNQFQSYYSRNFSRNAINYHIENIQENIGIIDLATMSFFFCLYFLFFNTLYKAQIELIKLKSDCI